VGSFDRARNWALGLGVVGGITAFAGLTKHGNPERPRLERELRMLDAKIAQKRAIDQDRPAAEQKMEEVRAELDPIERSLSPDIEALLTSLTELGVNAASGFRVWSASWSRVPLSIESRGIDQLMAAVQLFEREQLLVRWRRIDVALTGWAADLEIYAANPERRLEPLPAPPRRWFSSVNDDLRRRIEQKKKEHDAIEQDLGDLALLPDRTGQLKRLTEIAEHARAEPSIHAALKPLLLHPKPAFATVAIFVDETRAIVAAGDATGDVDQTELEARLPASLRLGAFELDEEAILRVRLETIGTEVRDVPVTRRAPESARRAPRRPPRSGRTP
jgi:hypothetical protein